MKVSVLIPTYQRPEYLRKCLESLFRQSRPADEIIVISVDETVDKPCIVHRASYIEILINKANIVYAENQGLAVASGDIFCFIDDDAVAAADWIERITRHYELDPMIGGVGGPVIPLVLGAPVIEHTKIFSRLSWIGKRLTNSTKVPFKLQEADILRGANMSFRKELIGKCDENLLPYWRRFEDDICLSVKGRGYKIICDPGIKVFHSQINSVNGKNIDDTPQTIIGLNHNSIYVKLKHFKFLRKICAVIYEFILGDETTPGLLPLFFYAVSRLSLPKAREFFYAFGGKVKGILTYLKSH